MTPAAQYAQKRAEAIELIRQHAPQRLQAALIELLRPAIALSATRAEDAQIPLGASKFGGAPDVPADFEWPMWNEKPLGFLAQINLEEVAPFDVEGLLPKSGLLSFFVEFDLEHDSYSQSEETDSWHVYFFDSGGLIRAELHHKVSWKIALIKLDMECSLSTEIASDFDFSLEGEEDQWDNYLEEIRIGHRMFGYPDGIEDSPAFDCETAYRGLRVASGEANRLNKEIKESAPDWNLLLQVSSDDELGSWGDWGRLFFMIRSEDLAARNFDKVGFSFQSH